MNNPPIAIAVHGGAGTILKSKMTPEKERGYRDGIESALNAGYILLRSGGSALDATQAAVESMEDNPLFNAGKGAVFTHDGVNEQDACIMDGATKNVGAVAGVKRIASPIRLARLVLEYSDHVLLGGDGAERFAVEHGMELVEGSYFFTEYRWNQLQKVLAREKEQGAPTAQLDHSDDKDKMGTVGAVAVDRNGNVAASTSTGGMTNKRFGRIGDSPIIGAGTYADNATCAVSTTGVGEYFMRAVTAYDVAAIMLYQGKGLADACDIAVGKLGELGGSGGLVAIDRQGNIAMPFNSAGMYRGAITINGSILSEIFQDS